ncbi:hypothetical protein ACSNOH_13335 [Streptomyces sp. URMC 127]|uniref:hypothetical protein n=1 Tax=Streptomyces sp. URMC 127 TaxID=3423402 RepID=UPI003F1D2315
MYSVFDDDERRRFHSPSAYTASAVVNMLLDAERKVTSDLWSDYDPTAMLTPTLYAQCAGDVSVLTSSL